MAKPDLYEVLGVSRDASERDIKKAYKRMAMKYHPDRTKGDKDLELKFKEVKTAYEVLMDPQKRAAYDQYGHAAFEQGQGGFGGGGAGAADFADIFGDVFGDIFGGGGRRGRAQAARGADLRYNLELSLEEAVRGKEVDLKIPKLTECDDCDGSGARAYQVLKPVRTVMVVVIYRCGRASLPCNNPVPIVVVAVKLSKIRAAPAMGKAVLNVPKR